MTVMTDRLDGSSNEANAMRSFGVFAVDESSNEILHYTEQTGASGQMSKTLSG
jgi:hypothetical protein